MAIHHEWIFTGPYFLHDLERGIAADGMNTDETASGPIARASGAITRLALNSAEALAR
jgi:hypothetical protein